LKIRVWSTVLLLFLVVKAVTLYSLYVKGVFALPWALAFTSVWYVICGLFFWFYFDSEARREKFVVLRSAAGALLTVVAVQLSAMIISIAGQLLLIKTAAPGLDEWDGVLAGYSGLYVYGGYAAKRVINIGLQFTTNYHAQMQEWSIILVIEVLALVLVFRKIRGTQRLKR